MPSGVKAKIRTVDIASREEFIARNFMIKTKAGELVPLIPNACQERLSAAWLLQRKAGLPVRIVLVKPRQIGWSTWISADLFFEVWSKSNRNALMVSDDLDGTNKLFSMVKLYDEELPSEYHRPKQASNRKEIIFSPPHRSSVLSLTAGKSVLGRGSTIQYLHGSEVAYWPHGEERLGDVMQAVPMEPGTSVVLESTAFGVGGVFYDTFVRAIDRRKSNPDDYSGWLPCFVPWYEFSDYSLPAPPDMVLNDEENWLVDKYVLTKNQLYWRRLKLAEPGMDDEVFKQEYPATPMEAFRSSGRGVFSAFNSLINKWQPRPGRTCMLARDRAGVLCLADVGRVFNCWHIWEMPVPGHDYVIGCDTMEGRSTDTDDVRSEWDKHGVVILDRHSMHVVGIFYGQCEQVVLGEQLLLAGEMYNNAYIAPELPNGLVVLNILKQGSYEYIYDRQKHDERLVEVDTENLGWRTTVATRPLMVESLMSLMRDGALTVYSSLLIEQFRTFIRDKTGKPTARPGAEDDLLFGLMIAVQLHLRCPLNQVSYSYNHTWEHPVEVVKSPVIPDEDGKYIDTFDPMLLDDDEIMERTA